MSSTLRRIFVVLFIFGAVCASLLLYATNSFNPDRLQNEHRSKNAAITASVKPQASVLISFTDTTEQTVQFAPIGNIPDGTRPSVTDSTSKNSPLLIPRISATVQSITTASRVKEEKIQPERIVTPLNSAVAARDKITTIVIREPLSKPTSRPRSCSGCMQHNFRILLQPKPCQSSRIPDIVFVVISSPGNTQQRHAIRNSWAKSTKIPLRTIFLFGSPKDATYNAKLKLESDQFGDILQEDFVDSYGNLTYKTMMAFKWVKNNCRQTKYVFKTDDDMWVNVKEFRERVRELRMKDKIGGMCLLNAAPIRNQNSKWYASSMQYPESTYPGFCTGTAYFMTANTAVKLFDISPNVPFFYLEDIYVSLCAERAGVKLLPVTGFYNYRVAPGDWCHYKRRLITSHGVTPDELVMLARKNCG